MSTGVRWPGSVVAEARRLAEGGWTTGQIARLIGNRHGKQPSRNTVLRWVDPAHTAKENQRRCESNRIEWAERWTFTLGSAKSPEYRQAFIRRLRTEGVPASSIAKVCTVVFATPVKQSEVLATLDFKACRECGCRAYLAGRVRQCSRCLYREQVAA